jgi:putative ABC transport system ATP-binding protein
MAIENAPTWAVECRDIVKDFYQGDSVIRALRGVDLKIATGGITLIVGPSGCGKTTLLSVISGILEPTVGDVCLFGKYITRLSDSAKAHRRRQTIGLVFQQFNLLSGFTAAENAAIPLVLRGYPRRQAIKTACQLLGRMEMADFGMTPIANLSSGQQQRVAIARGLITEPRLLICDEPTSALDSNTGHEIMLLLHQLAVQHDRAVLVVTHDLRLYEHANWIAHMEDGRILNTESRFSQPLAVGTAV